MSDDGLSLEDILAGRTSPSKPLSFESPDEILAGFGIETIPSGGNKPAPPTAPKPSAPGRAQPPAAGQGGLAARQMPGQPGLVRTASGAGPAPAGRAGLARTNSGQAMGASTDLAKPVAVQAGSSPMSRRVDSPSPTAGVAPAGGLSELQKPPACDICRTPHPESALKPVKHKKLCPGQQFLPVSCPRRSVTSSRLLP